MAKSKRGGQRANGSLAGAGNIQAQQNVTPPTAPQPDPNTKVDDTTQPTKMSTNYDSFMKMTDDEKADAISTAISQGVPVHLSQSDFQKFIYNSGLNDKPDIVSDSQLDSMTGQELFRNVNNVYDKKNDVSYNADQIAKQLMSGTTTRTSDNGGSAYGRGLYFATTYGSSAGYGNTVGNIKKTAVMRAKLNANAKVIDYYSASAGAQREISAGTKLGKVLSKCDHASATSIYAMAKGYNVISDSSRGAKGSDYINVLNRGAITMSSTVKPKSSKYTW